MLKKAVHSAISGLKIGRNAMNYGSRGLGIGAGIGAAYGGIRAGIEGDSIIGGAVGGAMGGAFLGAAAGGGIGAYKDFNRPKIKRPVGTRGRLTGGIRQQSLTKNNISGFLPGRTPSPRGTVDITQEVIEEANKNVEYYKRNYTHVNAKKDKMVSQAVAQRQEIGKVVASGGVRRGRLIAGGGKIPVIDKYGNPIRIRKK